METEDPVPFNKIVRTYIKIRDKREELTRTYKQEYDVLSGKMGLIKSANLGSDARS